MTLHRNIRSFMMLITAYLGKKLFIFTTVLLVDTNADQHFPS